MTFRKQQMKWIVPAVAMAFGLSASAANHSEFFHQTKKGAHEFTGTPGYRMNKVDTGTKQPSASVVTDMSGYGLGLGWEYGLMDMMSLGLDLQWWKLSGDNTPKPSGTTTKASRTGWEDIKIKAKAFHDLNSDMSLYFGGDIGYSMNKSAATNWNSGGHSLTPYVGFQHAMNSMKWGAKVAYAYKMKRKTAENKVLGALYTETTGGNDIDPSLFAEYNGGSWLAGLAAGYMMTGESKETLTGNILPTGSTTAVSYAQVSTVKSYNTMYLKAYGNFGLMSNLELIPSITYSSRDSSDYISKSQTTTAGVAGTAAAPTTKPYYTMTDTTVEAAFRYSF